MNPLPMAVNELPTLQHDGLYVAEEFEASSSVAVRFTGTWSNKLLRRSPNKRNLLLIFRQLALLLETGIDVAEAIELVAASCRQPRLQHALHQLLEDIRNGNSLGLAAAAQEETLGHQIVASIQAGEVSGRLVEVLRQISTQLEEDLSIRATIAASLAYPVILSLASLVVGGILVWFVLPQFEESFISMAIAPPLFTRLLFSAASFIRNNLLLVIIVAVVTGSLTALLSSHPEVKRTIYKLCFHSPLIGPTLRKLSVGQLFLNLGHLLANGISLLEAIQLVKRSTGDGAVGSLVEAWEHDVLEGRGLTHSLHEFDFLPEGSGAMLVMAERTGKLESVLTTAGSYYRQEGSAQLRQVLKLSEPLIIVLLGVFVGVVVASVLLPILDVQAGAGT
jgi:type IV pilus assembly protein PilC